MSLNDIMCKNCGNMFHGHFCNNCGQKAALHRINLKHLLHDFFHAITHLDRGYLHTAKEMFYRPGHAVREYLQGKRVDHPNPILMLIIIGGLCSLTYYNLELKLISSFKITELDGGVHILDSKFFAILYVLYSIIFSAFDFIFFRKKEYNFTELFILNAFISTEILLSQLLLVPLFIIGRTFEINLYIRILVGASYIFYFIYARYQFFEIKRYPQFKRTLVFESILFIILFFIATYRNFMEVMA